MISPSGNLFVRSACLIGPSSPERSTAFFATSLSLSRVAIAAPALVWTVPARFFIRFPQHPFCGHCCKKAIAVEVNFIPLSNPRTCRSTRARPRGRLYHGLAGAAQTITENCVADAGTTNVLSDAFLFQGFCDANDLGNAVSIPTPVDRRSRRAAVEYDRDNRYQSAASTQSPLA